MFQSYLSTRININKEILNQVAYNKRRYYEKVLQVQQITKDLQALGLNNTEIFKRHIENRFFISKRTFDEYLGIPAAMKLAEYLTKQHDKKNKNKPSSGR